MAAKRSEWKQFQRKVTFTLGLMALLGIALLFISGCNRTQRATTAIPGGAAGAYRPGENFSAGGETRCATINTPPGLKACN